MTRTARNSRVTDGAVFTFLAALLIAATAFYVCLNTKPGQLLPTELTLRENMTGVYIVQGIEDTASQAAAIREALSGNGFMTAGECWTSFADNNLDLFFILAVIFPAAARLILDIGFFLRFGLAAAFMYYFCCRHVSTDRNLSIVLGLVYAFSSQAVLLAQFASVMNMTVLLPVVLAAYDSFLKQRSGKSFVLAVVATALFAATGICADIAGLPFLVLLSLVMVLALYDRAGSVLSSWARLLLIEVLGILLAGFAVIPRLASAVVTFDIGDAFEKAAVNYTFFDILNNTKLMQPGVISGESSPVFYIGILTITLLVLFAANRKIPFRLKTAVFAITAATFITCASSFVRGMFTLLRVTPAITGSRFICLSALLIFAAALSLRNSSNLPDGVYYASCIIPCAFVVLSNIRPADGRYSALSLVLTVASYIVCACAVKYQAGGGSGLRMAVFAVLASFMILCSTAFLIAHNTIKAASVCDPYPSAAEEDAASLNCSEGLTLSVFTDSGNVRYLLAAADLSGDAGNMEYIRAVNAASQAALTGEVFEEEQVSVSDCRNLTADGMNRYSIISGYSEAAFTADADRDGKYFIYSSFSCPSAISYKLGGMDMSSQFDGAYLCEVGEGGNLGTMYLSYNSSRADTGEITLQRLNSEALEALNNATMEAEGLRFSFEYGDIPGWLGGIDTIIFSIPYSDDYTVSINGYGAETFEYDGRLAAIFSSSENVPEYDVVIGKKVKGLAGGITVTLIIGAFLVAMTIRGGYNIKASSDGGKAGSDAQQEVN